MFGNMATQTVYSEVKGLFRLHVAFFLADFLSAPVGAVWPLRWAVVGTWLPDERRHYHPPRIMEWTWTKVQAFSLKVRRDIPLHLQQLSSSHFSRTQSSDSDSAEWVFGSSGAKNHIRSKICAGSWWGRTAGCKANVSPSLAAVLTGGGEASAARPVNVPHLWLGGKGPNTCQKVRFGRFLSGLHRCAALASLALMLVGWKLCVAGSDLGLSAFASALSHA